MAPALQIIIGRCSFTNRENSVAAFEAIISRMLVTLGIETDLHITHSSSSDFLCINDRVCYFPNTLNQQAEDYMLLKKSPDSGKDNGNDDYWELMLTQLLWLQPSLLLPMEAAPVYMPALAARADAGINKDIREKAGSILAELLDLKIALTDKSLITEISNRYLNKQDIQWNELREELIDSLSGKDIAIFMHRDYFDTAITTSADQNAFEIMRENLFYETGIRYPSFRMVFDNNLPYAVFRFQVNHFLSMPVTGLQITSEIMVNDTTDRLQLLGISARQAINTFSSSNAAIISDADKVKAEDAGLSTWDSQGYFIRCFSSFLKKNSYLCVTRKLVREYFNTIKLSYPAVNNLFEKMGVFYLGVKVVRLLAREELSILNFHVITDAILESDCIIAEDHDYIIFDERVPVRLKLDTGWKNNAENVAEFTRTRMKKYISHKYTKGQSTLAVYLLDPAIERMANLDARPLTPADNETIAAIHKAVEAEIGNLPAAAQTPIILTTISVRPHIKKLLESAYPQLAVLSYQELSPELKIQPVARISLQ